MIKEIIVVEGRDDIRAVKRAVDAEVIAVGGFGINSKTIQRISEAQKRQGVIVLTDPDFAGEKIRKIISERVSGIKHAYISQDEGRKGDDIGVENALPEAIIKALQNAKSEIKEKRNEFTVLDLMRYGLMGDKEAKEKRDALGKELRIGYCNAAALVKRLNNYGITRKEFYDALNKIR